MTKECLDRAIAQLREAGDGNGMNDQSKRGPIPVKSLLEFKSRAEIAEEHLCELELRLRFARAHLLELTEDPRIRNDATAMMVVADMRKLLKEPT